MQWEFTPEQVVTGERAYGLEQFRQDLAREICINLEGASADEMRRSFALLYDMCHWLATGRSFELLMAELASDPPAAAFLRAVHPYSEPNVLMLGAILQRLIMERIEAGMPLESAVQDAAAYHRIAARGVPELLAQA